MVIGFGIGLAAGIGTSTIMGLQNVANALNYEANNAYPNTLPGVADLVDLYRRNYISKTTYYAVMKYLGYSADNAKLMYASQDSLITPEQSFLLSVNDYLSARYDWENDVISDSVYSTRRQAVTSAYYANMRANGFRKADANRAYFANRPLPSFSTILDWMAKEVFEDDAINEFELDAEQPTQLGDYMALYGVPAEEARKYWIAHWNPVGYGQWRELYNRFNSRRSADHINSQVSEYGLTADDVRISDDAYKKYFTVLEYSPYFRERLLAATSSQIPYTTLQDLYRYGIKTDAEIKEFLRDYNYSDVNAEAILETWRRKYPYGDKEPKLESTLYKFQKGLLTKAQARVELINDGVNEDAADYQLDRIEDDIAEKRTETKIKALAQRYGRKEITDVALRAEIALITTDVERRTFIETDVKIMAEKYMTRPSTRVLGRGYQDGKLTETEFEDALETYRMRSDDIALMKKIYAPE